ncbi:MAG: bifunctional sugar-1-phosphate nucleotidylyltransferase/acetyltransferase [Chloroflexota bacterium]
MKAVILAAGEGSRMRPLTYARPKVMLPLMGKPIMEHLLSEAKKAGVTEFVFVVGYHDEQIRSYFENGSKWGVRIDYATQRKQLGTADALKTVSPLVDEAFLMMNGDVILDSYDIAGLAAMRNNAMTLFEVQDTRGLGTVLTDGNRVSRIYEKVDNPPSHLANAGVYLFTPDIFDAVSRTRKSRRGEYEITDSIQILIDDGKPVSYHTIKYWLDLSYPWDLLSANESLMKGLKPQNMGTVEEHATIKGNVAVGKDTVIRAGSYIVGPVIIGDNCDIGPNCFIRPATSIGNHCHIGASCEVKNSIIMNGSKVPHLNYVGDSVIGEGCNLGAGTKIANLRLDKKSIRVGEIDTGRGKLGAIIGDNVQTGINACINVGALIGNNTFIGPGAKASGIIAPDAKIF